MQPAHFLPSVLLQRGVSRRTPAVPPETRPTLPRWKRGLDVACAAAALPVLGCTCLIAGVVTTVASPGPIFFRVPTVGENGRCFGMYRFRTLHRSRRESNVAKDPEPKLPYFTGGHLLHRSGLAKLPQIINVLRGEMTMVGAQPVAWNRSAPETSGRREPATVRPGIISATFDSAASANAAANVAPAPSIGSELRLISRSVTGAMAKLLR